MERPTALEADVIIVGTGLSGMIAAPKVLDAGLEPLVLEADERVGGRILTEEVIPGVPIELGAQWIGDTHERMFRLAAELGVQTYPQYDQGETTYELGGAGVLRENEFHTRFAAELKELELDSAALTYWPPRSPSKRPAGTTRHRMGRDNVGRLV